MKIVRREKTWIHTHFVTDGTYLSADREKQVRREMARVLEEHRIVFGLHFEAPRDTPGLSIVLECVPLPETLDQIERELARLIEPFPAKPRATTVESEPPARRVTRAKR